MSLIQPAALLLGLLGGLIVLMYLLKLKRRPEVFSSTMLWMRAVEDLTANAPFQKLRQNLLMWLQILALALLAFCLARPAMWLNRRSGASVIVLIDNSASMNARDTAGAENRLEAARDIARKLVSNLKADDRMMIITFGGTARVAQPFTTENGLLNGAIGGIGPTDAPSRIREAMLLVQSVRRIDEDARVTIISDGGLGYLGELITEDDPVEFVSVGESGDNRGIVAFDIRESFERRGEAQAFAEVRNFSAAEADVLVRCMVGEELIEAREATIPPGGKAGFAFAKIRGDGGKIRLELVGEDMLACDNAVEGIVNLDSSLRILLVTNGNFFLEKILSLMPGAKVSQAAPSAWAPGGDWDLVVFDHFAPEELGPGSYLFVNAVPPLEGFTKADAPLENQYAIDWNRLHPVTRFLRFDSLTPENSLDMEYPDWVTPLVDTPASSLIVAGRRPGLALLCLPFDIYATDWPLQPGFPVFMFNAVNWLAQSGEGAEVSILRTGETVTLRGAKGSPEPIVIRAPDGGEFTFQPGASDTVYFNETYQTGLYEVSQGENRLGGFGVNLLSPEESDITPKTEIVSGEQKITASSVDRENREVWPWFAMLGLAILTIEWHLFCRRSWL